MKACMIHAAGDVRLEECEEKFPDAGEVEIQFAWGGICGSDIHYFQHGRVGLSIVREPMVLGHEFSGTVSRLGSGVTGLAPGDKVAVNPAMPCGQCEQCRKGLSNLCTDNQFLGSAARTPHCHGGFAEKIIMPAAQCIKVPAEMDLRHVALAEPFAVALHAVSMAGDIEGQEILVTGAGVIGQLVRIAAKRAGAAKVIMADVSPHACERSRQLGADDVVNTASADEIRRLRESASPTVVFEASGAPEALDLAIDLLEPRGRIVQVGFLPPIAPLQCAKILTRELSLLGTYRFIDEFNIAVEAIVRGEVNLLPLISANMSLEEPIAAFERAGDKANSLKIMVNFQ
nr:L-idonate 5-dehydrogenase [uncultured Cohaesibacter sp.]